MKLLVSDYDYTMYDGIDSECIKKNVEAINSFMNNGNMFAIATGRAFNTITQKAIESNIPYNYLICQAGSSIFNQRGTLLYYTPLRDEKIFEVLKYLKAQKGIKNIRQISFFGDDTLKEYETTEIYCEFPLNEENKFMVSRILEESKKFGIQVISFTRADTIFIIFKEYMNKALGINYLAKRIDFPKEDIYTIGDEENDLEMLKEFNGFRVPNSSDILKQEGIPEVESVRKLIKRIERE